MAKDPYFDYAEVLLQISLVMASISILSSWFHLSPDSCGDSRDIETGNSPA